MPGRSLTCTWQRRCRMAGAVVQRGHHTRSRSRSKPGGSDPVWSNPVWSSHLGIDRGSLTLGRPVLPVVGRCTLAIPPARARGRARNGPRGPVYRPVSRAPGAPQRSAGGNGPVRQLEGRRRPATGAQDGGSHGCGTAGWTRATAGSSWRECGPRWGSRWRWCGGLMGPAAALAAGRGRAAGGARLRGGAPQGWWSGPLAGWAGSVGSARTTSSCRPPRRR